MVGFSALPDQPREMKHLDKTAMLLITHELDLAHWCADEIIEIGIKVDRDAN